MSKFTNREWLEATRGRNRITVFNSSILMTLAAMGSIIAITGAPMFAVLPWRDALALIALESVIAIIASVLGVIISSVTTTEHIATKLRERNMIAKPVPGDEFIR